MRYDKAAALDSRQPCFGIINGYCEGAMNFSKSLAEGYKVSLILHPHYDSSNKKTVVIFSIRYQRFLISRIVSER